MAGIMSIMNDTGQNYIQVCSRDVVRAHGSNSVISWRGIWKIPGGEARDFHLRPGEVRAPST